MSDLVLSSQVSSNPTSALMAATRGELSGDDFDFDLGIDLGEHNDLDGVNPDVPMMRVDSGAGVFLEGEQDPRQAPSELFGIILARQGSKVFFPPKERVLQYAETVGFKTLITDEKLKWICRCGNRSRPQEAELNPALTDAQREEAKRLGLGGATGRGCVGCPANAWYDPQDGSKKMRLCKDGENLIWLDSQKEEPVVLGVIGATSVMEIEKYLKTCFSKGKPVPLFRHLVKLGFTRQKSDKQGVKDWYSIQITNLQPLEKPVLLNVATAYKANLFLLERASKRIDNLDGNGFEAPTDAIDGTPDAQVSPEDVLGVL